MSSPHCMLHRNCESHSLNFLGYPWVKDDKASSNETSQHSLGCKQKLLVLQNQEDLQRLQIFNCNLGKAISFVLLCPAHKNRPAEPGWVGCTFWQVPPSWPRPPTIRMDCLRVVLFWPLSSSIPATESILRLHRMRKSLTAHESAYKIKFFSTERELSGQGVPKIFQGVSIKSEKIYKIKLYQIYSHIIISNY